MSADCIDDPNLQYPDEVVRRPFWQLKLVENSIRKGGPISSTFFLSKTAWFQPNVKLAGYAAKLSAYQAILMLLNDVQNINVYLDHTSLAYLQKAHTLISNVIDEFHNIQNQLAKPLPFIPEVSDIGKSRVSYKDDPAGTLQQPSKISSFFSGFKRNIRRYTGVGISRFNALPVKLPLEDLEKLLAMVVEICDGFQVRLVDLVVLSLILTHCLSRPWHAYQYRRNSKACWISVWTTSTCAALSLPARVRRGALLFPPRPPPHLHRPPGPSQRRRKHETRRSRGFPSLATTSSVWASFGYDTSRPLLTC